MSNTSLKKKSGYLKLRDNVYQAENQNTKNLESGGVRHSRHDRDLLESRTNVHSRGGRNFQSLH